MLDHTLTVPLDHDRPDGTTIEVFAREVAAPDGRDRPYLLFLQGGPGTRGAASDPLAALAGVARSRAARLPGDHARPARNRTIDALRDPWRGPRRRRRTARHFRADAIVRDAECLREHLGLRRWSLLGQSFGGFCSLHYLCAAPDSLREVYVTGGLPPVGRPRR